MRDLAFSIAISGKGGTGKTTISAILVNLLKNYSGSPILAVDADPNSNLNEALGVKAEMSVGKAREMLLENKDKLGPNQTKEEYFNYLFQSAIEEFEGFDLIVMGRAEGPGCYCYVNNLLRKVLDELADRYPLMIVDTEAGLEHFSRRTTRDIDILLVVTDPTAKGVLTAKRISEMIKSLNTNIRKAFLVVNRVPPQFMDRVQDLEKTSGLKCIAVIPRDQLIEEYDLSGVSLTELPESSQALKAVKELMEKLEIPAIQKGEISR
ncbi:MAG: AAA family ATPase [Nitrososphaerales archaeon]